MRYSYYLCDVFTEHRFGGNPLVVFPEANGLSPKQMQQIAREFNFSECAFLLPPDQGFTRKVRIFTPTREIPFAGHPNIGSAFVLSQLGEFDDLEQEIEVIFEEAAGLVPIKIQKQNPQRVWCELQAPEPLSLGQTLDATSVANALSLERECVVCDTHPPQVASVGLSFVLVELCSRACLARAQANLQGFQKLNKEGVCPDIHAYVHSHDEVDLRVRAFAPLGGIQEDPATGSANAALAALLTHFGQPKTRWVIAQGVEIGRPSQLYASTKKSPDGRISASIGGTCVMVGEGVLYMD